MWYRRRALSAAPRTPLASFAPLGWFVVMTALAGLLWLRGGIAGGAGLVPADHRPPAGRHVRLSLRAAHAEVEWSQLVDQLGPRLPGHRPLAAPPTESRAWLDAHLLYLQGAPTAAALAQRLEPAALRATVAGLRARLASPLFAVAEADPRQDPLGLRPGVAGREAGPVVTASGDLLSADGRTLLLYLRTEMPAVRLHAWISAQLAARFGVDSGIDVIVLPITPTTRGGTPSQKAAVDLLAAGLAALTLVLALGLRRVRAAAAIVIAIAAGLPLVVLLAGGVDSLGAPLLLASVAAAVVLAAPVSGGGLASALRPAAALLPLLLLPYPAWQRWALAWALGLLALVLAARRVAPALLRLCAGREREPQLREPGRPWPRAAALALCSALLAGGAWSIGHVSGDMLLEDAVDLALAEEFFAPGRLAELRSAGLDDIEALTAAAADASVLGELGPAVLTWVDAPGALVRGEAACAARHAELAPLDLAGRVELLRDLLAEQGLRADAFSEALRALDPGRQPTPEAALGGPLAAWFAAHIERDEHGAAAISRVQLATGLTEEQGLPAGLRGPAVFAHEEHRSRRARLGVALAVGAWLSAFLTWLTTRRMATAITAALIGLTTQAGALLIALAAGFTTLALLLPPLLIVGALAADAAARAGRSVPSDSRAGLALACALAPALVLIASSEPAWRGFGLVLGCGAVLGATLAARAAPGLDALLRRGGEGG